MIALTLLAMAGAALDLGEETPFEPARETFATAAACKAFLATRADDDRKQDFDAVEGPYQIVAGDVRIHTVRAEGKGHRIVETRCLDASLSARSWTHAMAEDEAPFTVESVVRSAPWLKKAPGQQQ
ncbi:MAG TPA: hypothetical protein VHM92_02920 [Allosphingosinicella sp.]|nr:hypothetical protein [Allosphingosinicella sp.]